ncbi:hypothetical protein SAMN05443432_11036 [Roseovarius litoreus]|uniref:Uncharacterized protein n=1 Tax=Roseovarius litoreus TaxID=1155722 RepID=A0A1M7K9L0_9RHOB|nr:hypothetical protein [Roseovarius litoreus]SHM61914.1 hypothetical protein SAMN05443432_11036 [Roseovarius litoreus]
MAFSVREALKSVAPVPVLDFYNLGRTTLRRRKIIQALEGQFKNGADGKKYLTYLVMQGMTNRIKAHIVAAHYAKCLGRTLVPVWQKTPECAAEFSDLFSNIQPEWSFETLKVLGYKAKTDKASEDLDTLKHEQCDLLVLDLDWQYIYMRNMIDRIGGEGAFVELFETSLTVRSDILTRVGHAVSSWARPMIGVQVRRGDFVKFRMAVPIERYIEAAELALQRRSDAGIYLASDASRMELEPFLEYFGDRCVFSESTRRDKGDGVRDAMYDLLLLSRCCHLILTKNSGFGHMAAQIGSITYEWVG